MEDTVRVEGNIGESRHGNREKHPPVVRQGEALPEVIAEDEEDIPGRAGQRALRRRILPLLDLEQKQSKAERIQQRKPQKNPHGMALRAAEKKIVEDHPRGQADPAEKPEETPEQGGRHHIIDQCRENGAGQRVPEVKHDPEHSEYDQRGRVAGEGVRSRGVVQHFAEERREGQSQHAGHDERHGERQKRNPAAEASAVPVRKVADQRPENGIGEVRKRQDQQPEHEVGNAERFHHQRGHAGHGPVFHGPREISPQQPEEQYSDPGGGVGQRSRRPASGTRGVRLLCHGSACSGVTGPEP